MAKTLTEAKLGGRAERKRLPLGVHWRGIDPNVHLGYRRGKRGGTWLVRWYDGKRYQQRTFATADDELREGTLDFGAAVKSAREVVEAGRRSMRAADAGPLLTVGSAVDTYVTARDSRECGRKGRDVRSDASSRLSRYVTGQPARGKRKGMQPALLAGIPLHELAEADLLEWRASLPSTLKAATKQRLINDLKAALNAAFAANRSRLPVTLEATIRHGLRGLDTRNDEADAVAREGQILTDAEVSRIVAAAEEVDAEQGWEGDLFRLVVVLAATGARFGQAVRLRVGDVQTETARLIIPPSRKGRGQKSGSTPFPVGADDLAALLTATKGRAKDAPLLERWRRKQVPGSIRWERAERGPWQTASEMARAWRLIRTRAGLPDGVVAYALRHSSIVRRIRLGQPVPLVAKLHDTSVTIIERHYGRYIADALGDLAARGVTSLISRAAN